MAGDCLTTASAGTSRGSASTLPIRIFPARANAMNSNLLSKTILFIDGAGGSSCASGRLRTQNQSSVVGRYRLTSHKLRPEKVNGLRRRIRPKLYVVL